MARSRVLLVFPRRNGSVAANDAAMPFPFLSLTQLAALFPSGYELRLVDEKVRPLTGRETADLVCITTLTFSVSRAYRLADLFRARGIPVILGGVHASNLPQEALKHATSVVIGEAEGVMDRLIADFESGRLAPTYAADRLPDLDDVPFPAWHLLNWRHRVFLASIQTSRGCPNGCDFCTVPSTFGRRVRYKSIATLDQELFELRRLGRRYLFVVDDNFTVNRSRAKAIMELFAHYGFRWMSFSNLDVAADSDFLQCLARSNCLSLFIGLESLQAQSAFSKNRTFSDARAIREAIARIHAHSIGIQGSFIFGFDDDGPDVFHQVASFIQNNAIEIPNLNILTPFPGTRLYETMASQGRLRPTGWEAYDMNHVVFNPAGMSPEELQQGFSWVLKYLSSPRTILRRLPISRKHYLYYLLANFALHTSQTKLAKSLWNPTVHSGLTEQGYCLQE